MLPHSFKYFAAALTFVCLRGGIFTGTLPAPVRAAAWSEAAAGSPSADFPGDRLLAVPSDTVLRVCIFGVVGHEPFSPLSAVFGAQPRWMKLQLVDSRGLEADVNTASLTSSLPALP